MDYLRNKKRAHWDRAGENLAARQDQVRSVIGFLNRESGAGDAGDDAGPPG